jgi:ParB-like chromosome segregation protein Spo0J
MSTTTHVVEHWPLDKLVPYARNPRVHTAEQVARIVASIQEFGWTNPILVDEDSGILAGHGRLEAAKILNRETVPVIVLTGLSSEDQRRAYIIADNKLALDSGWDIDLLSSELRELAAEGFDTNLLGFSAIELDALLSDAAMDMQSAEARENAWRGMPEYENADLKPVRSIVVHFTSENDAQAFARLLDQSITERTKYLWYPRQQHMDTRNRTYASDES